ncbi:hypothetical protein [Pseudokineococcus sp. 1T1Z-3]|uniref:hypothetical protein n=1 Tax=Pseudokineococcus sp. 1T1Z-3 TaxID=3132745 RepID=UPI0030DB7169
MGEVGAVCVDTSELLRLRAGLELLAADLQAAGARLAGADGVAVGARRVLDELERAQQDWGTHVEALRLVARSAGEDVGRAADAYEACEAGAAARVAASYQASPSTAVAPPTPASRPEPSPRPQDPPTPPSAGGTP